MYECTHVYSVGDVKICFPWGKGKKENGPMYDLTDRLRFAPVGTPVLHTEVL